MEQSNPKTSSKRVPGAAEEVRKGPTLRRAAGGVSKAPRGLASAHVHTMSSGPISSLFEERFGLVGHRREPQLGSVFRSILMAAYQYAPAESGSIAIVEGSPRGSEEDQLVFVASFGEGSELLVGTRLPADTGIMGRVFRMVTPLLTNDVTLEPNFYPGIDKLTSSTTYSLLSIPIVLESRAIGVLTLRNRLSRQGFKTQEMRLMQIFCDYLSTSIQNLLDFFYQKELALRDHLTGLRNDRFFYRQLLTEIEGCERYGGHLSLVFVDLDHFKSVVDSHGHLVGSQVIAQVGQLLGRVIQHPGATLARYGGDEYVILLPGLNRHQAAEIAEQVRHHIVGGTYLTEPLADGSPALNLKDCFTASLGVASYQDCEISGPTPDAKRHAFIRKADEAMYQAKADGKNRVFVHQGERA